MSNQSTRGSIVIVGGGTGAPKLARALSNDLQPERLTIICPVTDSGRSTGVARRLLRIPGPGDLRHCMSALAENRELADLLEMRLIAPENPDLNGMAMGNLIVGGLAQSAEDIGSAVRDLCRMLRVRQTVVPVSVEGIDLAATLTDGTIAHNELEVRRPGKAAIADLTITGESEGVWPPAGEALRMASNIILGPGSLWTSIGATLAVRGVREAIAESSAPLTFVCNTTTQPGQTDGMSLLDHVRAVETLAAHRMDIVIANTGGLDEESEAQFASDGLFLVRPTDGDGEILEAQGTRLLAETLLGDATLSSSLWQKMRTAYHDMDKLAQLLIVETREG